MIRGKGGKEEKKELLTCLHRDGECAKRKESVIEKYKLDQNESYI